MPAGTYCDKLMLDWLLGGTAANPPALCYLALCTSAPNSTKSFELLGDAQYARRACTFAAANAPGIISNLSSCSFGTFGATYTFVGVCVMDNATTNSGNILYFANLTAGQTLARRTGFSFNPSALTISLS